MEEAMGAETGEGVRGVKPTREELREAIEWIAENWQRTSALPTQRDIEARLTLFAFLDSGLTDDERNALHTFRTEWPVVSKALGPPWKMVVGPLPVALERLNREHATLAPIAEAKQPK